MRNVAWCGLLLWFGVGASASGAQGPDVTMLTQVEDRYPRWSADGESIWFYSNRMGPWEIYRSKADGSGLVRFPAEAGGEVLPVPAPDGRRVLFTAVDASGAEDLWLLDPATGRRVRLTDDPAQDTDGSWSPDGKRIWFVSNRSGSYDVWSMAADGADLQRVTRAPERDAMPALSPDGRWLVFQRTVSSRDAEIFVRDLESGREANVSSWSGGWDGWPSWSPDGRTVTFTSTRDGSAQLWQVPHEGGTAEKISDIGGVQVRRARWSPDGTRLVVNVEQAGNPVVAMMVLGRSVLLPPAR